MTYSPGGTYTSNFPSRGIKWQRSVQLKVIELGPSNLEHAGEPLAKLGGLIGLVRQERDPHDPG